MDGWQGLCCDSVARWSARQRFTYVRCGDELFDALPEDLRHKYASQPVVQADLGRLLWLQQKLDEGYDRAIWCDADMLVFRDFAPSMDGDSFGRETWVQLHNGRLRSYRKIHNAWLQFVRGSSTLAFYIERACAALRRADAPVVPQFIGPKLLTAWHNILPFPVEEQVGMLSPLAMAELLGSGAGALDLLRAGHEAPLAALNLSASMEDRTVDGVGHSAADYQRLIDGLLDGGRLGRL